MPEKIKVVPMERDMIDESVDLFMNTFSKEPWNDVYESRQQVVNYFENVMNSNRFEGYAGIVDGKIIAICLGFQKAWIKGFEFYIDEFCVSRDVQGCGIGSEFLNQVEANIKQHGMNAMLLNTQQDFPARKFYEKNGFSAIKGFVVLAK